jgi:Tat protein translocase TatB subunit
MLDVGFSEILLTSAIALIVLGPEKLPKVARQVGNWVGRARAMARQLTEQLEREVSAEELMRQTKPTTAAKSEAPPPASVPAAEYSPENAAAVQGADWHPNPLDHKPPNE